MVSHDLHLVMSTTDRVVCINTHLCCEGTRLLLVKTQDMWLYSEPGFQKLSPFTGMHMIMSITLMALSTTKTRHKVNIING